MAGGAQRDAITPSFQFWRHDQRRGDVWDLCPWLLKVNGSATMNQRLESGGFRGFGGSVALVRRF
jgi:hypothetical protein